MRNILIATIFLTTLVGSLCGASDITWSHIYGTSDPDYGFDVSAFTNSSFILVGREKSNSIVNGVYARFSADGTPIWYKRYGTLARSITRNKDGTFFGVGYGQVIKLDSKGNAKWQKTYLKAGSTQYQVTFSLFPSHASGYRAIGTVEQERGFWIGRLTESGEIQGGRLYSFCDADTQYGQNVRETPDGSLLYAGKIECPGLGESIVFGKLNAGGALKWQKEIRSSAQIDILSLQLAPNGNFFLAGTDLHDVFLLKFDPNGNLLHQTNLDFTPYSTVRRLNDGTFLFTGGNRFLKLDSNSNVVFNKKFRIGIHQNISSVKVIDNGYILTGNALLPNENTKRIDIWIARLDQNGEVHGSTCVQETSVIMNTPTIPLTISAIPKPTIKRMGGYSIDRGTESQDLVLTPVSCS